MTAIERISVELSQRCSKACWFCYSASHRDGGTSWTATELIDFVRDCAAHGLAAVSFGGGEPLESPLLWPVLEQLRGVLFRSLTSNGLLLDTPAILDRLCTAAPDKVHLSIHFPGNDSEVQRVIRQVNELTARGIASGVNLLVQRSQLVAAELAARSLQAAGIDNRRIVYLPMRGRDTPSAAEVAQVAGPPFQSMSCLTADGVQGQSALLLDRLGPERGLVLVHEHARAAGRAQARGLAGGARGARAPLLRLAGGGPAAAARLYMTTTPADCGSNPSGQTVVASAIALEIFAISRRAAVFRLVPRKTAFSIFAPPTSAPSRSAPERSASLRSAPFK